MEPHWQRRQFLHSVSSSLVAVGALGCSDEWVYADDDPQPPPPKLDYKPLLTAYFGASNLDAAQSIGNYYITTAGWDVEEAIASTAKIRQFIDELAPESEADRAEALDIRLQRDFEMLRVIDVDGWTLGQTEIDLCILATLV